MGVGLNGVWEPLSLQSPGLCCPSCRQTCPQQCEHRHTHWQVRVHEDNTHQPIHLHNLVTHSESHKYTEPVLVTLGRTMAASVAGMRLVARAAWL